MILFDIDKIKPGSIVLMPKGHKKFNWDIFYHLASKHELILDDWETCDTVGEFNLYISKIRIKFFLHKIISVGLDKLHNLSQTFISDCLFATSNGSVVMIHTTGFITKILSKIFGISQTFIYAGPNKIKISNILYTFIDTDLILFKESNKHDLCLMYQLMHIAPNSNPYGKYNALCIELKTGIDKCIYVRMFIRYWFVEDICNYIFKILMGIILC